MLFSGGFYIYVVELIIQLGLMQKLVVTYKDNKMGMLLGDPNPSAIKPHS